MERAVRIELFGQTYTFRADAEVSRVEVIADYVLEQVAKAQSSAEVPGKLDTVILAALNIANDYFEMKNRCEEVLKQIDRRCTALIENINIVS